MCAWILFFISSCPDRIFCSSLLSGSHFFLSSFHFLLQSCHHGKHLFKLFIHRSGQRSSLWHSPEDQDIPLLTQNVTKLSSGCRIFTNVVDTIGTTVEIRSYREEEGEYGVNNLIIKAEGRQRFEVLETRTQSDGIIIGKVRILPELQVGDPGECSKLSSLNKFAIPPPNLSSRTSNSFHCNQLLHRSSHKYNKYDFANYTWFPEFVYKMYDPEVLMNRLKTMIQNWNKTMRSDLMPCNPKEFSYWVAANLPLDDRQRLELLRINEVTHRLRHELKILEECCVLTCRDCQSIIANREDIFSMSLQGPQGTYVNPNGYVHEAITVYKAKGLRLTGRPSTEQSWFPGYAWTIVECEVCTSHMGWRFTAVDKNLKPSKFWALCRSAIQNRISADEPSDVNV
ncbi:Protein cereblon [Araneus ventricosus]|uniref:Protein cereblon n=1 Tax=Araneus ventricosus TaxID=182803 RepID=A0A4Y2EB07_ARAVE|nr:Protein cereblon [Araneus ventricosus]